jgi:hypothetical protein
MRDAPASSMPSRLVALCAFIGYLPQLAIGPFFLHRVHALLDVTNSTLTYAYDAGHVLGLAAASWLALDGWWRLPPVPRTLRAAVGCSFLLGVCYLLLGGDLDSYNKRHIGDHVPWHLVFSIGSVLAILLCVRVGCLLSRPYLRWLALAGGVMLAVANHVQLGLDYRGLHLIVAVGSAALIGTSCLPLLVQRELPSLAWRTLIAVMVVSLLSYVVIPNHVVRRTLLASPGALVAPFVTRAWMRVQRLAAPPPRELASSPWLAPRRGLPAVPPNAAPWRPRDLIVILLTVDALREDVALGPEYEKQLPNFASLARNSVRFTHAWSPAPNTRASLSSIFLGTHYSHQQRDPGARNDPDEPLQWSDRARSQGPSLAAELERGGVHAVNVVSHEPLLRGHGVIDAFGVDIRLSHWTRSRKVAEVLSRELRQAPSGPLFLYAHVLDAHSHYYCGKVVGTPKERYLGAVRCVDGAVGRLRTAIKKNHLSDRTYLIVAADHGEAFGEHGRSFHATTVYEEMIRVPLLIEGPGVLRRTVDVPITLLDLGPTILSLFGLPTPATFMGESLVPFMRNLRPKLTRPIAVDSEVGVQAMLFEGRMKAIVDLRQGTEELYDLRNDPGELRNLAERSDAAGYFAKLREFFAERLLVSGLAPGAQASQMPRVTPSR